MRSSLKRLLSESALSIGANLVSMGTALLVAYVFAALLGGRGGIATAGFLTLAAIASTTWGSWISLSWTRNRVLRSGMKAVTLLPGLLLLALSVGGLYVGFGSILAWLALTLSALGTVTTAVLLWRELPRTFARHSGAHLTTGFLIFPALTSVGASIVGALWIKFAFGTSVEDLPFFEWSSSALHTMGWNISGLFSFSTVISTVLAFTIVPTALPALVSAACRHVSSRQSGGRR